MQYPVIIEHNNGVFRAIIPALPALSAEGASREEAVANAQRAVDTYLAQVEVATIEINLPQEQWPRPGTPEAWLKAVEPFVGDEEAIREHFAEIAAERQREREEMEQLEAA
jgi:predicted RNase H-like HicB family nuclease